MKAFTKKPPIVAIVFLVAQLASAGEAVDGINGKLDFSTGSMDSHWGENYAGSLSLPVCTNFGLQLDGLYSHVGNQNFGGGGFHFFYRDSDKGLLGLTSGGMNGEYLYGLQGGLEGQYFLNRFTLGMDLGVTTLQYAHHAPFIDTHPVGFYATPSVSYYPTDNLMVTVAYSRYFDNNFGQFLLEYQTPAKGLSCFTELAIGDNGYDHALFGLRYYFGKNKSLIRRHREDDPPNLLRSILYAIGTYGAEFNRDAQSYIQEHPSGGGSSTEWYGIYSFSLTN